ncbi:MAG: hypothetical protein LH477_03105, partial [Nocardioides sp.]|nr:hypothetical protein [Nocardioides sp.]
MPAISRAARPLVLALAGLGLVASAMSTPAASATSGDELTTATTSRVAAARRVASRLLAAKGPALRQRGAAYAYG